jgi:hypothetical protein
MESRLILLVAGVFAISLGWMVAMSRLRALGWRIESDARRIEHNWRMIAENAEKIDAKARRLAAARGR